jgi:hypothetical protein
MIRSPKRVLASAAVVLALSLAACGGGGSDEDEVRSAAENFASAFKDENWSEVCALMTKQSKAQLEEAGKLLQADGCEAVWKKAANRIPEEAKQQLDNFAVDTIKVNGNTATVTSTSAQDSPAQLRKEDGAWKVNFAQ